MDFKYYRRRGIVFSFGDFNARLGKYTGDRSVDGKLAENRNKNRFMAFLTGIEGEIVNRLYAYGKYTNTHTRHIRGGRSIIDFCIVKKHDLQSISNFSVLKVNFMGGMVAVCHTTVLSRLVYRSQILEKI